MKYLTLIPLLAVLLTGCASSHSGAASAGGYEEPDVVTGSNIPRREKSSVDEAEQQRLIREMQRASQDLKVGSQK